MRLDRVRRHRDVVGPGGRRPDELGGHWDSPLRLEAQDLFVDLLARRRGATRAVDSEQHCRDLVVLPRPVEDLDDPRRGAERGPAQERAGETGVTDHAVDVEEQDLPALTAADDGLDEVCLLASAEHVDRDAAGRHGDSGEQDGKSQARDCDSPSPGSSIVSPDDLARGARDSHLAAAIRLSHSAQSLPLAFSCSRSCSRSSGTCSKRRCGS